MTHGSLFSGIGGFDLAAEWMGWENKFHCEWNPFGQKVLKHYWPKAESFTDITKSNFEKYAGTIDVISGGFPCQPYSIAGKRFGKDDARHLWPEMLRVISEVRPRWVVGENVRGLTNWNGGMVFNEVQSDLETIGFEVLPFLLPACAVNAPHRRDRIWFIAHSTNGGCRGGISEKCENGERELLQREQKWDKMGRETQGCSGKWDVTNSESIGRKNTLENGEMEGGRFRKSYQRNMWDAFPSVAPICDGNDGISERLDGITFSKWRNESIKAGGNAIVPQVAFQIFKAIQQYENLSKAI